MSGDDLEVVLVAVADLRHDPTNPNTHNKRNLDAIEASLREFGQRKPLVVSPDLMVIAGNGTLEVMRDRLGWAHAFITVYDSTAPRATAYGVADNRTAELAGWDDELLRDSLIELPENLTYAAGYDPADLAEILRDKTVIRHSADFATGDEPDQYAEQYAVIVPVDTEEDQMSLLARLTDDGYHCKAITT